MFKVVVTVCIIRKYKTLPYIVFFTDAIIKFVCVLRKPATISEVNSEFKYVLIYDLITVDN